MSCFPILRRPAAVALAALTLAVACAAAAQPPGQAVSPLAGRAKLIAPIDTAVPPGGEATARVVLRLQQPLRRQVAWDCGTANGNTYAPTYFPTQTMTVVFRPGETEVVVPVKVNRLAEGEHFFLSCAHSRNQPPIAGVMAKIVGARAPSAPPANPHSPPAFAPPPLERGRTLAFRSDFLETVSPEPKTGEWGSRPHYGRIIGNNEEGVMAHAATDPGIDPHPVNRARERVLTAGWSPRPIMEDGKPYRFFGSMMHTLRLVTLKTGLIRFEAKLDIAPGSTGAFWLLPANLTWPPEIDGFEIGLGGTPAEPNFEIASTVHGKTFGAEGYRVPGVLNGDGKVHRFELDLTDREIITLVDGREIHRRVNPHPGVEWYILFDVSVGGITFSPPNPGPGFRSQMMVRNLEIWK